MGETPDILTDSDNAPLDSTPHDEREWIVRQERRDSECQYCFVDKHGNINSRISSAMLLHKDVAKQYAKVITEQHPKYLGRAMVFRRQTKAK